MRRPAAPIGGFDTHKNKNESFCASNPVNKRRWQEVLKFNCACLLLCCFHDDGADVSLKVRVENYYNEHHTHQQEEERGGGFFTSSPLMIPAPTSNDWFFYFLYVAAGIQNKYYGESNICIIFVSRRQQQQRRRCTRSSPLTYGFQSSRYISHLPGRTSEWLLLLILLLLLPLTAVCGGAKKGSPFVRWIISIYRSIYLQRYISYLVHQTELSAKKKNMLCKCCK